MPAIKPMQFPSVDANAAAEASRIRRRPPTAARDLGAERAQATSSQSAPQPVRPADTRQEKLDQAIEVLRSKSLQLYHPDRSVTKPKATLGQVIDIKA